MSTQQESDEVFSPAVQETHPSQETSMIVMRTTGEILKATGIPLASQSNMTHMPEVTDPGTPYEGYPFTLTSLKEVICKQSITTKIRPILLLFSGIPPDSGQTMAVNHLLDHYVDEIKSPEFKAITKKSERLEAEGIIYHELVATGFKHRRNICITEVTQESSCAFGILSAFKNDLLEGRVPLLVESTMSQPLSLFDDQGLNGHLQFIFQYLYKQESIPRGSELSEEERKYANHLKKLLPEGIALINVWDLALNKTVCHFLTALRGHLYNNYTWLFLDLERDLENLHKPPEIKEQLRGRQQEVGQQQLGEDEHQVMEGGHDQQQQQKKNSEIEQKVGQQQRGEDRQQAVRGGSQQQSGVQKVRQQQRGEDEMNEYMGDGQQQESRDGAVLMKWRSRLHYLLRSCRMSEDRQKQRKRVCTIFAKHAEGYNGDLQQKINELEAKVQSMAKHIGVEELLEEKIETINLGSQQNDTDDDSKRLYQKFQHVIYETPFVDVPVAWVFLRSLFYRLEMKLIKKSDLKRMAEECGMDDGSLARFCKFYTSFGSIFDLSLVNSAYEFVVIKPIRFLKSLDELLYPNDDVRKRYPSIAYGIVPERACKEVLGKEWEASMDALVCLALATRVSSAYIEYTTDFPSLKRHEPYYFIPLCRTGSLITDPDPASVHLITSISTPHVFRQVTFAKHLLDSLPNPKLVPCTNTNQTTIKDTSTGTTVTLVSHSPATKIHLDKPNLEVCCRIVKSYNKIAKSCDVTTQYKFVKFCVDNNIPNVQSLPSSHYHVLPDDQLCQKCREAGYADDELLKVWNEALKKHPIDPDSTSTEDLKSSELAAIAEKIVLYDTDVIAETFGFPEYKNDEKFKGLSGDKLITALLLQWHENKHSEIGRQEPRHALARKLSELGESLASSVTDEKLKEEFKKKFEEMAREVDAYY